MIISFDVGGTNMRAALVDGITLSAEQSVDTPKGEASIDKIVSLTELLLKEAAKIECNGKTQNVCIGVPGTILNGKITLPNVGLKDYPLVKNLQKKLGKNRKLQFYIENDARCAALGESYYGAGKKKDGSYYSTIYCITLGTGVGGSLVIDQHLFRGRGNASQICCMTINFDGIKDKFDNPGAFENYCGARGILRIAEEKHNLIVETPLDVYNLAKKGNKDALASWKEYGFYLGVGITNILPVIDPDIVVLSGGLSNAWPYFNKEMFKTIKERALFKDTPVVQSHLKNAGILGASLLAKN